MKVPRWAKDKHPIFVHVPVALWTGAAVCDGLASAGVAGAAAARVSLVCILGGLVAASLVIPTGLLDWSEIKRGKPAWKLGLIHLLLNLVITGLFAVNLALRWPPPEHPAIPEGAFALTMTGASLLLVSAYLGGRMVYDQGIGVARHSKQFWRKLAADSGANVPPPSTGG